MNNSKFWNSNNSSTATRNKTTVKVSKGVISVLAVVALLIIGLGFVFYVAILQPALSVMADVNVVKADSKAVLTAISNRDLVTMDTKLTKTEKDLATLRTNRDAKLGWARNMTLFKLNEFYSDSDRFLNAANTGISALREVEGLVKPFASAAGLKVDAATTASQNQDQGLMEAFQTWVSLMPQVAGQMDGVIAKVALIGKELAPINTAKYPEEINGIAVRDNLEFIKDKLSKAGEYGPDIKQALTIFPRVLAVGTPEKRYMIIMQNDKELRPTGGFMTNYATFKIKDGLLQSDFSSKDMYSIDLTLMKIDATYTFPKAPDAYTKWLKVEHWYARDMNSSPDFVDSMNQFMKFYSMAGRIDPYEIKPVDGIVAIDTDVVKELLDVTGPVTVSGVTYTKDNVVLELERIASLALREQANRKKVLGNLMQAMLENVFKSDQNLWAKIINKGIDLAVRKHIQAYVFDADAQALIEKYNFGGRITENVNGDYAAVISTNLGGDKTNWFVSKKVTHTLAKEGNKWVRTIKIDYSYPQPAADYGPFVKRFRDWVRVYVPLGSQVISVTGSEDGTGTDQDRNKTIMTGFLELGPTETKTMTFKYYLPEGVIKGDNYTLTIQKQSGIDSEQHTVEVMNQKQEIKLDRDTQVYFKLK